jgi:hypothetical protein
MRSLNELQQLGLIGAGLGGGFAPVANEMTVRIVMALAIMAGWYCALLDVVGAFLNGRFGNDEKIYMKVPQRFEKDMLYAMRIMNSIGLKVELPMRLIIRTKEQRIFAITGLLEAEQDMWR